MSHPKLVVSEQITYDNIASSLVPNQDFHKIYDEETLKEISANYFKKTNYQSSDELSDREKKILEAASPEVIYALRNRDVSIFPSCSKQNMEESIRILKEMDASGEIAAKERLITSAKKRDNETLEIICQLSEMYPGEKIATLLGKAHDLESAKTRAKNKNAEKLRIIDVLARLPETFPAEGPQQ